MTSPVICITGGASGMGLATAKKFASNGWQVILIDLVDAQLQKAKEILGEDTLTLVADVTQEAQMQAAMASVSEATGGRLDILFNNAGIAPGGLLEAQSTETIR
ncbi:MAG: SDR family NAD(P)-dependent oxidoreductase, partial [Pseudomonadales bacterium]